jgi:NADH:ubiquinone oxidoreductase subunit 2 (subunit N)
MYEKSFRKNINLESLVTRVPHILLTNWFQRMFVSPAQGDYLERLLSSYGSTTSFDWLHVCVSVIPTLCLIFGMYLLIFSAIKLAEFKSQKLTNEQLAAKKLELTISNLTKMLYFIVVLFIFEIINKVNWDRQLYLFGEFFVSNAAVSTQVCILLFFSFFGVLLLKIYVQREKVEAIDLPAVLFFLLFFLLIITYSNNFIILLIAIEGVTLCTCVALALTLEVSINWKTFFFSLQQPLTKILNSNKKALNHTLPEQEKKSDVLLPVETKKQANVNFFLKTVNPVSQSAISASLFYFLLNVVITISFGLVLFLLISSYNTLGFLELFSLLLDSNSEKMTLELKVILVLLIVLFCFKLGIVPFHFWLPSVFSGANYVILYFLAIPVKLTFLFLMYKLFYGLFFPYFYFWGPIFLVLGMLSIIVGSIGLFTQKDLKKFFAYSTINHFGYIFLAFGCGNFIGQQAFFIYFFSYLFMNVAFLYFISSLINIKTNKPIVSFAEISNVQFNSNILQFCFALVLLSMLGLPPLLGFWGKYMILMALIAYSNWIGYFFCFLVIITSVIAATSYLSIFKTLFISSKENLQIIKFHVFSLLMLKVFFFFTFVITFGWVLKYNPVFVTIFNNFIISVTFPDYIGPWNTIAQEFTNVLAYLDFSTVQQNYKLSDAQSVWQFFLFSHPDFFVYFGVDFTFLNFPQQVQNVFFLLREQNKDTTPFFLELIHNFFLEQSSYKTINDFLYNSPTILKICSHYM